MLNLIRCEFWKLKRKMFVQLVLAASFLFPIPLTAIIYYLNTAQNKYATKAAAFDALWQSVIGFGMIPFQFIKFCFYNANHVYSPLCLYNLSISKNETNAMIPRMNTT